MKKLIRKILIPFILMAIITSACDLPISSDGAVTQAASTGSAQTATVSGTGTTNSQPVTVEPVINSVLQLVDTAPAPIVITSPGEGRSGVSHVVSPVTITGEAEFPFEGTLSITLAGEDGSVITQSTTQVDGEYGGRGSFTTDVDFSIDHDQPGRISVYTVSMRDGGLIYLTSVPVMLLSSGSSNIQPAGSSTAPVQFISPLSAETISGGTLVVHGMADQLFENTLNITICGPGGSGDADSVCGTADNILESGTSLQTEPSGIDGMLTFSYLYHFFFPAETPTRVAVYSISPRDGGIEWLVSVEITLRP